MKRKFVKPRVTDLGDIEKIVRGVGGTAGAGEG